MTQREFIKLYAEVKPTVVKSLVQRGRDDAEDILQTTMLELCRTKAYAHVGPNTADVTRFLFGSVRLRILRAKSLDYAARAIRTNAVDVEALQDNEHPLTNPYPALDATLDVRNAIAKLPVAVGVAVSLVYLDGHTLEEAAKIADVPMRTLQKRIQRAMPALRELLKAYAPVANAL